MGIDLSRRHRQPEIMDAPDLPPARFTETLRGLKRVNVVTSSSALMWPDLEAAGRRGPGRRLRVLDVACGGGGLLRFQVEIDDVLRHSLQIYDLRFTIYELFHNSCWSPKL